MLDYKDIITKHYVLGMSGSKIAESLHVSKSGVNDFLRSFKACKTLGYPLPHGITNYGIAEAVYGKNPTLVGRDLILILNKTVLFSSVKIPSEFVLLLDGRQPTCVVGLF